MYKCQIITPVCSYMPSCSAQSIIKHYIRKYVNIVIAQHALADSAYLWWF